jgi:seryl-tRNA(Sec) selenium transferase
MLDISGSFETWNPPVSLIPKEKFSDRPERGVGRGMKVSKEAIIGLLVALENFTENKLARKTEHLRQLLEGIRMRLESVTGLEMTITEDRNVYPSLQIKIDKQIAGKSAAEISQKLKDGKPSIFVGDMYLQQGMVSINSINIDEKIASVVGERLYTVFTGHHDS